MGRAELRVVAAPSSLASKRWAERLVPMEALSMMPSEDWVAPGAPVPGAPVYSPGAPRPSPAWTGRPKSRTRPQLGAESGVAQSSMVTLVREERRPLGRST